MGSRTMVAADPRYTIDFDGPKEYDCRGATVTYKLIPNKALHGHFQDGSQQREGHTRRLHHRTHDAFLALICRDGLKTTFMRHEVTGCWFRVWLGSEMFAWGLNPLDFVSGCYITCIADSDQITKRRLSRKLGPDRTKAVVQGPAAWSADIAVRCESITFRIPSPELETWREEMRDVCWRSINEHGFFLGDGARENAAKELWGLLQHSLSYDCPRSATNTGRWKKVHTISVNMAQAISSVLRPILFQQTIAARRKSWRPIVWQSLPIPFREFLERTYVGSMHVGDFFHYDNNFDAHSRLWVGGHPTPEEESP